MTSAQELATIENVDLRQVWPNEAQDFTPWLEHNLDALGNALGMDLEFTEREAEVGRYALDILARDPNGDRPVVIENQLGETDHAHLGQLLTYAAGYEANVVIWIASEFRDEHREALDLLNRRTDEETECFGVVVEVWKIDGSRPAPHFKVVSAPNDWRKAKRGAVAASPKGELYRAFYQELASELGIKRKVGTKNWFGLPSVADGFGRLVTFGHKGKARVVLYIDNRDKAWNERQYDRLLERKDEIEREVGGEFMWQRLDGKRSCSISAVREGSIDDDDAALAEIRAWMVEKHAAFGSVFGPLLAEAPD